MSLASYEPAEPLLPAPTSVFSATRAPFLVLFRSGDAPSRHSPARGCFVRYRRISVYQERVTPRAPTGRRPGRYHRPDQGVLRAASRRALSDARAPRGARGRSAPRTPRSDGRRMSGARCRICVAQAGWSALTTSVVPVDAHRAHVRGHRRPHDVVPATEHRPHHVGPSRPQVAGDLAQRVADPDRSRVRAAPPVARGSPGAGPGRRGRDGTEARGSGLGTGARPVHRRCRSGARRPPPPPGPRAPPAGGRRRW